MPATKSATTIQASATNSAGGTTTSASVDLTQAYGMFITAQVINGATPPTNPCTFAVEVSNDNSVWREVAVFSAAVTSSATYNFPYIVDITAMYARTVFTGNTAEDVTVEALGHILTGI